MDLDEDGDSSIQLQSEDASDQGRDLCDMEVDAPGPMASEQGEPGVLAMLARRSASHSGSAAGNAEELAEEEDRLELHSSSTESAAEMIVESEDGGQADALILDDSAEPSSRSPPSRWRPGRNCGAWLEGKHGIGAQAQVLIVNLYLNLRRLPAGLSRCILQHLTPGIPVARNFPDRLAAQFLGVSHSTARWVYDRLSSSGWQPADQDSEPTPPQPTPPGVIAGGLSEIDAMKIRVREILAICSAGRPDSDYVSAMQRLQSHGLAIGSKQLSRRFVEPVEFLAATAARALTAGSLSTVSPSLGIASDLSIVWDGVSIGARSFSRYETLYLVGAVYMDFWYPGVSRETTCKTTSAFMVGPSAGQSHTGPEQADLILRALAEHPAALTKEKLKSHLAAVGSDGAATKGGENSQHSGTRASEMMWEAVHPQTQPVAEWDLFHRVDLAASKAVSESAAALEIFDVARVLASLFGIGSGRVIFRASAAAVGQKHLRVPEQGGTRKVVALTHTVDRLMRSLKSYHAALHARRGQAEGADRRGAQSKAHLVAIGRRVTALSFVTFATAVGDVLRTRVTPLALRAQGIRGASWEMDSFCHTTVRRLEDDAAALACLRRWCFVSALLQQYASSADLQRLWFSLIPLFRKSFPTLSVSAYPLLHKRELHGCQLTVVQDGDANSFNYLSPKCQCPSMRSRPGIRPRLVRIALPFGGRRGAQGGIAGAPGGQFQMRVPEWVAHTVYDASEWQRAGAFIGPRFVRVRKAATPPPGLDGVCGRFRQGAAPCRCVVPVALPAAVDDVLSAISEAIRFATLLAYYLRAYAVGSVGVPRATREMLQSSRECWDWSFLVQHPPRERHYKSFFALYKALLPTLRFTTWPTDPRFGWLAHSWPALRGRNGAFEQYRSLMQRVRAATAKQRAHAQPACSTQRRYLVEPVFSTVLAASLGLKLAALHVPLRLQTCVLHVISGFLEDAQGVIARASFEVAASELAVLGCGRTAKKARSKRSERAYRGSRFASLASPHMAGCCVEVLACRGDVDEEAIAAALFTDQSFVIPDSSGIHCWHAVRTYMRARLQRAPESECERWGSLLHDLWDEVSGWEPHRMVSRLLIREAGLDGSPQREDVVSELAEALLAWRGKTPFAKKAAKEKQPCRVASENLVVRRGLREHEICREAWKLSARPCTLLDAAAHAVREAERLGRGGALAALPVFAEDVRTTRKSRAGSSVQAALAEFMSSAEGRQRKEDRKALFGNAVM